MLDPQTGFIVKEESNEDPTEVSGSKKRVWQETNKQEWMTFYQSYMENRSKIQPQPLDLQGCEYFNVGRDGLRNYDKTDYTMHEYLELSDSENEETDQNPDIHKDTNFEGGTDGDFLIERFGKHDEGTKKPVSKKLKRQNLRYNSLKLVKYSNICLFKWARHCFVCFECRERFKDMQTLRNHVENSHSYDEIKAKFINENIMLHKADISGLECQMCFVKLSSLKELEIHLMEHEVTLKPGGSTLVPFKHCSDRNICQLCGNKFVTNYSLHKHTNRHFLRYKCPKCKIGFTNNRALKEHWRTHYTQNKTTRKYKSNINEDSVQKFKCKLCSQKFRYDYTRIQHMILEHKDQSNLFQCEFCPKIFMTIHWLMKHKNCVHKDRLYS